MLKRRVLRSLKSISLFGGDQSLKQLQRIWEWIFYTNMGTTTGLCISTLWQAVGGCPFCYPGEDSGAAGGSGYLGGQFGRR